MELWNVFNNYLYRINKRVALFEKESKITLSSYLCARVLQRNNVSAN
jgi:hypothetical protein